MRWVPALTVSGHPQDNGLVKDVFDKDAMKQLGEGSLGLGHVRYPTAGSSTAQEAQPFFVNSPLGIYLVCWQHHFTSLPSTAQTASLT